VPEGTPTSAERMSAIAAALLSSGFTITPLHDMTDGRCSCGNPDPEHSRRQGGKHPRLAGWQRNPIRDHGIAAAVWRQHPSANIGIVTGAPSGIWVLDVDPDSGGPEKLAELIRRHGSLPRTYTVTTGSGGTHYYFRLPSDFRPTNSRGRLPIGIDVRGDGGQVVAAGSVSGKGPYVTQDDSPITDAPQWLLDLIRPSGYDMAAASMAGQPSALGEGMDATRGRAYAQKALGDIVAELASTPQGGRNDAAFRAACRLVELGNAGWLDPDATHEQYLAACQTMSDAAPGAPFPRSEADAVWRKAATRVGGAVASLPADQFAVEPMSIPLSPATQAGGSNALTCGTNTDRTPTGHRPDTAAFTFTDPGTPAVALPLSGPGQPPNVTPAITLGGAMDADLEARVAALMGAMLDPDQIGTQPPPEPLVNGLLSMDSLAWLIGAPGSGKSFVTLDIAAHVATGQQYRGTYTKGGTVVYIVAEGAGGMGQRVNAWRRRNGGASLGNMLFLPLPVQAGDQAAWGALVEACRRIAPALVVVDTQSRVTSGIDENSNTDMMRYVHAVDALRAATGACVLTVHHMGRNGTHARGASAIDGAQDTELRLERVECEDERRVALTTSKQKDGRDDVRHELVLDTVELGASPWTGEQITSLAVRPAAETAVRDAAASGVNEQCKAAIAGAHTCAEAMVALVKVAFATGNGGTAPQIKNSLCEFRRYGRTALHAAFNELIARGAVARVKGTSSWRYVPVDLRAQLIEPIAKSGNASGGFFFPGVDVTEPPPGALGS